MRRLPPLAALRAFEAAARHMSFKRAAAELAVTPTAISHHVRLLEATAGVRLFERRPRQLTLTRQGQALFPVLRDGLDRFAEAFAALKAERTRTVVTLSATPAFTARLLVPRVAAFQAAHPEIDLRLHASEEPADLRASVADAALRYGRGPYPGLVAEKLFTDSFAPVCARHLDLRSPADLRRHKLIHFEWRRQDPQRPIWPRWLERAGIPDLDPEAGLRFTDESHAIQAAIAGHGVALLSLALLADELASGALVQPFGPTLEGYSCWLVYLETSAKRPEIAGLRHWIHAELGPKAPAA